MPVASSLWRRLELTVEVDVATVPPVPIAVGVILHIAIA